MGGNAGCAVEGVGDLPIGGPIQMSVDCLQHLSQSPPTLLGQPRIRARRSVVEYLPEACKRFDAIKAGCIKGHKDGDRRVVPRIFEKQQTESRLAGSQNEACSNGVSSRGAGIDLWELYRGHVYQRRCSSQNNRPGISVGLPIDDRFQGVLARIDRE